MERTINSIMIAMIVKKKTDIGLKEFRGLKTANSHIVKTMCKGLGMN